MILGTGIDLAEVGRIRIGVAEVIARALDIDGCIRHSPNRPAAILNARLWERGFV